METMSFWSTVLLAAGLLSCSYVLLAMRRKTEKGKFPPGPPPLPIMGNVHMLGDLPYRSLRKLSQKYGPIMSIRLGLVPTIIASSPQVAQHFLKTHDAIFATRPLSEFGKIVFYDRKGLGFSEYGPYWRNARKLCTLELLSNQKIDAFKFVRKEEMSALIESIKEAAANRTVVNLSNKTASVIVAMSCRMLFGQKYMDEKLGEKGFKSVIQETMRLAGSFNIADFVPFLKVLDLQGLCRQMKELNKVYDDFFEKVIDEHVRTRKEGHQRDFIDALLSIMESKDSEFQVDRTSMKGLLLDMLIGGVDTSSATTEWVLSEIIRNPRVMKKVQDELTNVVGMDRMVEESDLVKLEYLDMVIKETLRLHPVSPLLVPREAMEDIDINGYHIPKGTRIIINAWAIGRDPSAWTDPEEFRPERFAANNIDYRGMDCQFLPFGSGRRGCPGVSLGLLIVRLILAQSMHCFNWELPIGIKPSELDMSEKFSLIIPRATPLMAIPSWRLHKDL